MFLTKLWRVCLLCKNFPFKTVSSTFWWMEQNLKTKKSFGSHLHSLKIAWNSYYLGKGRDEKGCKMAVDQRRQRRPASTASTSVDHWPGRKEQDGRGRPVEKGSGRRRPGRKEQDGWHRPRKGLWRRRRLSTVNIYKKICIFKFWNNNIFLFFKILRFKGTFGIKT